MAAPTDDLSRPLVPLAPDELSPAPPGDLLQLGGPWPAPASGAAGVSGPLLGKRAWEQPPGGAGVGADSTHAWPVPAAKRAAFAAAGPPLPAPAAAPVGHHAHQQEDALRQADQQPQRPLLPAVLQMQLGPYAPMGLVTPQHLLSLNQQGASMCLPQLAPSQQMQQMQQMQQAAAAPSYMQLVQQQQQHHHHHHLGYGMPPDRSGGADEACGSSEQAWQAAAAAILATDGSTAAADAGGGGGKPPPAPSSNRRKAGLGSRSRGGRQQTQLAAAAAEAAATGGVAAALPASVAAAAAASLLPVAQPAGIPPGGSGSNVHPGALPQGHGFDDGGEEAPPLGRAAVAAAAAATLPATHGGGGALRSPRLQQLHLLRDLFASRGINLGAMGLDVRDVAPEGAYLDGQLLLLPGRQGRPRVEVTRLITALQAIGSELKGNTHACAPALTEIPAPPTAAADERAAAAAGAAPEHGSSSQAGGRHSSSSGPRFVIDPHVCTAAGQAATAIEHCRRRLQIVATPKAAAAMAKAAAAAAAAGIIVPRLAGGSWASSGALAGTAGGQQLPGGAAQPPVAGDAPVAQPLAAGGAGQGSSLRAGRARAPPAALLVPAAAPAPAGRRHPVGVNASILAEVMCGGRPPAPSGATLSPLPLPPVGGGIAAAPGVPAPAVPAPAVPAPGVPACMAAMLRVDTGALPAATAPGAGTDAGGFSFTSLLLGSPLGTPGPGAAASSSGADLAAVRLHIQRQRQLFLQQQQEQEQQQEQLLLQQQQGQQQHQQLLQQQQPWMLPMRPAAPPLDPLAFSLPPYSHHQAPPHLH